jgi:hypothetical protein
VDAPPVLSLPIKPSDVWAALSHTRHDGVTQ